MVLYENYTASGLEDFTSLLISHIVLSVHKMASILETPQINVEISHILLQTIY